VSAPEPGARPGEETRPGFEKLLDGQSKKRGAVAPLVGVGYLT